MTVIIPTNPGESQAFVGDVTKPAESDVTTLVGTANVESIVRANSLDQLAIPASAVNLNGQRITDLAKPSLSSDAQTALGAVLDQVIYAPATSVTYTTTVATPAAVDSTNLTVSFTAISTQVLVEVDALMGQYTGTDAIGAGLVDHGTTTLVPGSPLVLAAQQASTVGENGSGSKTLRIPVTGLVVGTAYSWDLAWAVGTTATTAFMEAGISTTWGTSVAVFPVVMSVLAA